MAIEPGLIKPVVDALLELIGQGENLRLKRNGAAALREAIRELLQADPDENRAAARIAIAKAAGIISEDVVLAEDMLKKHRASKLRTAGKASSGRKRDVATKPEDAMPTKSDKKGASKTVQKARGRKPLTGKAPPKPGK